MQIKAILFDLDGTLLPLDQDVFTKTYFKLLAAKLGPLGFEPKGLVDAIWKGISDMQSNESGRTNAEIFWARFAGIYGAERTQAAEPHFAEFYQTDFQKAQSVCGRDPLAAEAVQLARNLGFRVVLATNPVFPSYATESRVRWAGLNPEDFEWITSYENCHSCKPSPAYYRELAAHLGCAPEECLMVGNDTCDDMEAEKTGMHLFLLTDHLINREGADISRWPNGGFPALMDYLRAL